MSLAQSDPKIAELIAVEQRRQESTLELIARLRCQEPVWFEIGY